MKNYKAVKDKSGNWYVQKDGKTYCEMTWICGDPELNAALLAKKLNEHEAIVLAARQIEGCSEIRPSETPGGYKRRILETMIDALAKTNFPVS